MTDLERKQAELLDKMAGVIKNYCIGRGSSDTEYARQALAEYNEFKGKK